MKAPSIVLGLAAGLLAAGFARADCHNNKLHDITDLKAAKLAATNPLNCRVAVLSYGAFFEGEPMDVTETSPSVQLTVEEETATDPVRTVFNGQTAFNAKLAEDNKLYDNYTVDVIDSDHFNVRKKFLFFWVDKTQIEDMAEISWEGSLLKGDRVVRREEGWAVVIRVDKTTGPAKMWQLSSMFVKRKNP